MLDRLARQVGLSLCQARVWGGQFNLAHFDDLIRDRSTISSNTIKPCTVKQ